MVPTVGCGMYGRDSVMCSTSDRDHDPCEANEASEARFSFLHTLHSHRLEP